MKAVLSNDDGTTQIVGYAKWQTVLVDKGGVGIYGYGMKDQRVEGNTAEKERKKKEGTETKVKTVANERLCDDLFIPGDRYMALACDGKSYHSKCRFRVCC